MAVADHDWLAICRRATAAVETALKSHPDREEATGTRGEGGDRTLVIDSLAEEAIFAELEATGIGLTAISEERGRVEVSGGGPIHVVIDPIDGSRNAKRRMPAHAVSIAAADDATMGGVGFGYVKDLGCGEEWWAEHHGGAYLDGNRLAPLDGDRELELLALEMVRAKDVTPARAETLAATGAPRLRALGCVALSLCGVAAGRFDALVTMSACRSVDSAAGQLIVREAGGIIEFTENGDDTLRTSLDIDMRSPLIAAASADFVQRLRPLAAV